jgi:Dolichyl-phosphate-mannose-protein mannosyltransferase
MRTITALAVAVAALVVVLAKQPVTSPWWIYADADASYTATGIDLMAGEHTIYLDHPGMPLQDAMAITVEARYLVHKLAGSRDTPHEYAARRLLDLDDSRPFFRGFAILFYAAGALFAFVALSRLMGGPWWGAAGTLLWLGAPGLQAMSIQYRPDGLLAGAVLAVGFLIARAAERRSAWTYTLAALLLGLALTLKIHAAALVVPFGIALVWRPPPRDWWPGWKRDAYAWLHRYRWPLVAFTVVWISFCALLDPHRIAAGAPRRQELAFAAMVLGFLAFVAIVLALRRRLPVVLAAALALGLVLPGTLVINDLPEMLIKIVSGLTGSGANSGVEPFSTPWRELVHQPLLPTTVLLAVAAVAAVAGARRRDFQPLLWFGGSALAYVMASARLGTVHYYAPAYVLAIPPSLWLVRRLPGRAAVPAGAAALLVVALWTPARDLGHPDRSARRQERQWAAIRVEGAKLLRGPGQLAVAQDYTQPIPDIRWHALVSQYVAWVPAYHYRYLDDSGASRILAAELHLVPRYYVGGLPLTLHGPTREQLAFGDYLLTPLPDANAAAVRVGFAALSKASASAAAALPAENRSRATSLAAAPSRARSAGSPSSLSIATRSAAGSRGGTSRPVTPSSIASG